MKEFQGDGKTDETMDQSDYSLIITQDGHLDKIDVIKHSSEPESTSLLLTKMSFC